MKKYCTEIILAIILLALSLISIFVGVIDIDIKDLLTSVNSTNSTATTDVLKNYLSTSITSDGHLSIDIHNAASSTSTVLNHIVLDNVSISTQTAAEQYLTDLITNNHLVIK